MQQKTVNDMYTYSKSSGIILLSNYSSPFWNEYVNNFARYDALFRRMFYSFRYFMQDYDDTIETITSNFTADVYNHLMVNDKKYSELYRVHVIPDEDYSITDNYNVTETMDRETSKNDSDTYGGRTDTTNEVIGERTDTSTSSTGERTDTSNETLGGRSDSVNATVGSRTDTNETTTGSQTNTGTDTIAGFNSSGFENDTHVTDTIGNRTDNSTNVTGQQNNTSTNVIGQQSNSSTNVTGQQSSNSSTVSGSQNNTSTFQKSSQSDTHTGSGTEDYTLTRVGNIGVKTVTEVMKEHTEFWSTWEFYTMIFKEICAELLLI